MLLSVPSVFLCVAKASTPSVFIFSPLICSSPKVILLAYWFHLGDAYTEVVSSPFVKVFRVVEKQLHNPSYIASNNQQILVLLVRGRRFRATQCLQIYHCVSITPFFKAVANKEDICQRTSRKIKMQKLPFPSGNFHVLLR